MINVHCWIKWNDKWEDWKIKFVQNDCCFYRYLSLAHTHTHTHTHTLYIYIYIYIYIYNAFWYVYKWVLSIDDRAYIYCVCVCVCVYLGIISSWRHILKSIIYGKFISQFRPYIIKFIQRLERIKIKICRQKTSILYIYIYIYMLP